MWVNNVAVCSLVNGYINLFSEPETIEEPELPKFEFHVAYGAPTDGRLYKELATKGNFHSKTTDCVLCYDFVVLSER